MNKEIKKTVTYTDEITLYTKRVCDKCGKLLEYRYNPLVKGLVNISKEHMKVEYYEVTTGHHDWGNDSIDSVEHHDYCPTCVLQAMDEYYERTNGKNNTQYLEINHESYEYGIIIKEGE